MKIIWSADADNDLGEIVSYFSCINEKELALQIIDDIFLSTDRLVNYPLSGRVGRIVGTRELILTHLPYIVIYEIKGEMVFILTVIHSSRLFP